MKTQKQALTPFPGSKFLKIVASSWVVIIALAVIRNNAVSKDPLTYIIPNILLFTPFRGATAWCWKKFLVYNKEEVGLIPIPELSASEYNFEKLREITDNFKHPGVVRGLFKDTAAVQKWATPEYLDQYLGNFSIPVIQRATYGTDQQDRIAMDFRDSWGEIVTDKNSMKYLFFPVKSRIAMNASAEGRSELLQETVNEIARKDLDLDRLWHGFGSERHNRYHGAQIIAGQGGKTGTHWHCAPGNNWFIQVAGKKRWYMMDQEYSAYMQPKRNGMFTMWTGAGMEMTELEKYLPIKYVDIEAGDMLYNPNWEWHTIHNYEGLSIGVPIRESNITLNFQNNLQYTMYAFINKALDMMGTSYGLDK